LALEFRVLRSPNLPFLIEQIKNNEMVCEKLNYGITIPQIKTKQSFQSGRPL
tara:strand:- start:244 stop:399 length:156 start_codon:yes stop_codon:yes gene_type:complete